MVGLVILFFVVILFRWIAPDTFKVQYASAGITNKTWEAITEKDAELEAKIAALETRISVLESRTCSCQNTGSAIDNSGLNQRIDNLEAESKSQKGLLDNIYQMLLKLFALLTQVLGKLK